MTTGQVCILVIGLSMFLTYIYAIIDEELTKRLTRQLTIQIKENMRIEKEAKDELYFRRMLREVR